MPSTFVHGFLPASCAYYSRRGLARLTRAQSFRFFVIAFLLGNSCDLDLVPATIFSKYWSEIHREWGHNLFAITLWVILGAAAIQHWVSQEIPKRTAYTAAALLVFSHVLFDSMGVVEASGERAGVPLLWPFSERTFVMPLALFKGITLHAHGNPLWQHIVSREFWTQLFLYEIAHGATLFVAWVCVWRISRGLCAIKERMRKKKTLQSKEKTA